MTSPAFMGANKPNPSHPVARFHLQRATDATGISGTGRVAEGVMFRGTGKCVLAWNTKVASIALYDSLADVIAIHGHGGQTLVVFEGDECPWCGHACADHWADGCGGCMHGLNVTPPLTPCCNCVHMGAPTGWRTERDLDPKAWDRKYWRDPDNVHVMPDDGNHVSRPDCHCAPEPDAKTEALRAQGESTARIWVHHYTQ